jgi:pimeloyl-ACP methyl ester carboxylesterase
MMRMNQLREGDVNVRDVRLHYIDWGGDGAPIVLLHATGLLGRIYRPIAQALTAVGHVFSYDQRGHGDSGVANPPKYDWALTARDLEEFIRAMGLDGTRAFGHSAGATAIGAFASTHPELISRAVLTEPVLFESPESPEFGWRAPLLDRTLKRKRVFDSVEAMFANFERKPPYDAWRTDILHDYCEYGTRLNADGKRELKCSPQIEAELYGTAHEFDGLGLLLRCEIPLLVMFGQRPGESPGAPLAPRLESQMKNARFANFPDAGHFLPMEKPEEVGRQAADFLRQG